MTPTIQAPRWHDPTLTQGHLGRGVPGQLVISATASETKELRVGAHLRKLTIWGEMTSIKEKGTLLMCARVLSPFDRVRLYATLWTVAHQAPLSMGFSRQEHWCRLPCPPPGDLPDPGNEPTSPALQLDSLHPEPPGKPTLLILCVK